MLEQNFLDDIIRQYRVYKDQCERAQVQVPDEDFFTAVGQCPHSIAILTKHLGGSLRSRWRNFLTTDGEKRDRNRESEFSVEGDTRESILAIWDEGWRITFDELARLTPADLERSITIRGEPLGVVQAIIRNLLHVSNHTGQIILLARQIVGENWQTLSIAPGQSEAANAAMRARYGDWWAKEDPGSTAS